MGHLELLILSVLSRNYNSKLLCICVLSLWILVLLIGFYVNGGWLLGGCYVLSWIGGCRLFRIPRSVVGLCLGFLRVFRLLYSSFLSFYIFFIFSVSGGNTVSSNQKYTKSAMHYSMMSALLEHCLVNGLIQMEVPYQVPFTKPTILV